MIIGLLTAACSSASATTAPPPRTEPEPPTLCQLERGLAPASSWPAPTPAREPRPSAPPDETATASPDTGCTRHVDDLPSGRGATEADERRLHDSRVVVADKSARRLMLFDAGTLQACWPIALGFAPAGHKEVEGDGRTPEGWYALSDKPWSVFQDAIAIHYPATRDADDALADGLIEASVHARVAAASRRGRLPPQRTAMGGEVLIHGGGTGRDWTLGCIALADDDLRDLRSRLPDGMRSHLLVLP